MKYKDNTIVGIYKNFSGNFFLDLGVLKVCKRNAEHIPKRR